MGNLGTVLRAGKGGSMEEEIERRCRTGRAMLSRGLESYYARILGEVPFSRRHDDSLEMGSRAT
jgi:hypothetical protein